MVCQLLFKTSPCLKCTCTYSLSSPFHILKGQPYMPAAGGHPGIPQGQIHPMQMPPSITLMDRRPPHDYLPIAVLTTVCCFWPTGIIAIIKAVQVNATLLYRFDLWILLPQCGIDWGLWVLNFLSLPPPRGLCDWFFFHFNIAAKGIFAHFHLFLRECYTDLYDKISVF